MAEPEAVQQPRAVVGRLASYISALSASEFFTLYPVNPATAARYRQAFKPSRAKSDPTDAQVCLELLLQHCDKLSPLLLDDPQTRQLGRLLEHRRGAVDLRTLLTEMLRAALKSYYPQALSLAGGDLFAPLACQFLLKWPSLPQLQKARPETIRKFYYAPHCRRPELVQERLSAIAQMIPLSRDPALVEPAIIQVQMFARQLLQLGLAIKEYDRQIQQRFALHRDAAIWQSFPGAGPTLAPASPAPSGVSAPVIPMLAPSSDPAGSPRSQRKAARTSTGSIDATAVPTSSIKASSSTPVNQPSTAPGPNSSSRSKSPKARVTQPPFRALAFKWQRIMYVCWRDRVPYDENAYLATLTRRGSPLAAKLQDTLKEAA
ncbi:MAG: IS110 family transposase [Chthoniobacterales bacterium]